MKKRAVAVLLAGVLALLSCGNTQVPAGSDSSPIENTEASAEQTETRADQTGSSMGQPESSSNSAETPAAGGDAEQEIPEGSSSGTPDRVGTIYEDLRVYTPEELAEQEAFDQFTEQYFVDSISENSFDLHFTLRNPEAFGIEEEEATWGTMDPEFFKDSGEMAAVDLEELRSFSYSSLNYEQKLLYDIFESSLNESINEAPYYLLAENFSPLNGIQTQIPILFGEYPIESKKDLETCLTLLGQTGEYVDFLLDFEEYRAGQGYFLSDSSVDTVVEQCQSFLEGDENCILTVLRDRIQEVPELTAEEKAAYTAQAAEAVDRGLIPAYEQMIQVLSRLKGSRSYGDGLAAYPGGKEYYALLMQSRVGTNRTPEELIAMTEAQMEQDMMGMYFLLSQDESLWEKMDQYEFLYSEPEDILDYLAENLGTDFPAPVVTQYTLKYVHEAMEDLESPAYYMIPAMDNWQENTIYVNQNPEYDHMDLFTTLAHEGFPGHLYQQTYFSSQDVSPLRYLIGYNGFTEGWATYVELQYGYSLGLKNQNLARILALDSSYSQGIYTRVDLGIHYEGWDQSGVSAYLSTLGIEDEELAQELFETLIDDPAVYPAYHIGYLEILNLRERAVDAGVSLYEFHKFMLEIGPVPFAAAEKRMLEYFDIPVLKTNLSNAA